MSTKVLLADDSMTAQNIGKKILTDAGFDVVAVSNGAQALKKIPEHAPDIVILDVYMPGYSGLEVCEKLRNAEFTAKIPVVLTVGKMEPYRTEDGERVKADGVIIKPFEASDLIAVVTQLVESATPAAPAEEALPEAAVEAPEEPVDIQYGSESILSQDYGDVSAPAAPFTDAEIPANAAAFSPEDLLDMAPEPTRPMMNAPDLSPEMRDAEGIPDAFAAPAHTPDFGSMHIDVPDAFAAAAEFTVAKEEEVPLSIPMLEMAKEDEPFFAAPPFTEQEIGGTADVAAVTEFAPAFTSEMLASDPMIAAMQPEPTLGLLDAEPVLNETTETESSQDFLLQVELLSNDTNLLPAPGEPDDASVELEMFAEQSIPAIADAHEPLVMGSDAISASAQEHTVMAFEHPAAVPSYISAMGSAAALTPAELPEPYHLELAEPTATETLALIAVEVAEPPSPEISVASSLLQQIVPAARNDSTLPIEQPQPEPAATVEVSEPFMAGTALADMSAVPCTGDGSHPAATEIAVDVVAPCTQESTFVTDASLAVPEPSRMCCSDSQPGEPNAHLSASIPVIAKATLQALSSEQIHMVSGVVARVVERMLPSVLEQVLAEMDAEQRS